MPFKLGQPRPANAGRKRGTPNKSSTELEKLLDEIEFELTPEERLIAIATCDVVALGLMSPEEYDAPGGKMLANALIPIEEQAKALREIWTYLYPKRKAVEHTGEVTTKIPIFPVQGPPPGSAPVPAVEHG